MTILALIPIAASIILACVIIYYYFPLSVIKTDGLLRMFRPLGELDGSATVSKAEDAVPGLPDQMEEPLEREVRRVRKLVAELNKGRLDLEWSERQLEEKSRKLDMLMARAEQALQRSTEARTDNYSKAGVLLELGLAPEDIKSRLGLLAGEVELMEKLRSYGSGMTAGPERQKAPYREHPSHQRSRARTGREVPLA